jgi:PLP dependent protein
MLPDITASVDSALKTVRQEIAKACRDGARDPHSVTLIAVSKTFPASAILEAHAAGQTVFGENRVQEAQSKWLQLKEANPAFRLHLLGPLQSNKVKDALSIFDTLHSLDRASLCEALAKEIARSGKAPEMFVQVNTGAEPQKAGVLPQNADSFIADCRDHYGLPVTGLMCIPPIGEPPATHFNMLREIATRNELQQLSMGMSGDFPAAIACGATHVRVGTAIFGGRPNYHAH